MTIQIRLFERQIDGSERIVGELADADLVSMAATRLHERRMGARPVPSAPVERRPAVMQKLADGRWVDAKSIEAKLEMSAHAIRSLNESSAIPRMPAATGPWSKRSEITQYVIDADGRRLAKGSPEANKYLREQRKNGAIL